MSLGCNLAAELTLSSFGSVLSIVSFTSVTNLVLMDSDSTGPHIFFGCGTGSGPGSVAVILQACFDAFPLTSLRQSQTPTRTPEISHLPVAVREKIGGSHRCGPWLTCVDRDTVQETKPSHRSTVHGHGHSRSQHARPVLTSLAQSLRKSWPRGRATSFHLELPPVVPVIAGRGVGPPQIWTVHS